MAKGKYAGKRLLKQMREVPVCEFEKMSLNHIKKGGQKNV